MEIPLCYSTAQRSTLDPPDIRVYGSSSSDVNRSSSRSSTYISGTTPIISTTPMSIPKSREDSPPPFPPPPRNINPTGPGIAQEWENRRQGNNWLSPSLSITPGSSLFGSNFSQNGQTASTIICDSIPGRTPFQSSMHTNFRSDSQLYDKLLIKKLESRRGTNNATPPQSFPRTSFSSSLNETSPTSCTAYDYQQPVQKAFSMPIRNKSIDIDADFPIETSRLQRLRINDNTMRFEGHSPTSAAGQKRRASSPPKEDGQPPFYTVGSANNLFQQRDSASQASPTPRLYSSHGSVSSQKSSERNSGQVKKPKKFETEEELNAHKMERQYKCQYCKNRFKKKNEAERHQNSLHLQRRSWSCAALPDYSAAFHDSLTRPTDTCGYCGEEFLQTTISQQGRDAEVAADHDRETRIEHLVKVHSFRECNQSKKFFRADHFRQHLRHSHRGTSGKWLNILEDACMKDEPLKTRRKKTLRLTDSRSGNDIS